MTMSHERQVRLLSRVEIFGSLSREEVEDLAGRVPDTYLARNDILYTPRESSERLFILKEGRVQVYELSDGGEEITLTIVEGGSVFGEMSLTGQSLEGLYVRALAPSYVASLKRSELEDLIRRRPEVGLRLVELLARRLRDAETRYANVVQKDVPARLATLILTLVESEGLVIGESYRIPTRYTHEQLGSMIGARRVAVTRAFRRLREAGGIEMRHRQIIVKDRGVLEKIAAG